MTGKIDLTVAAYLFRPDTKQLLLIHNRKLNKWLPPGGHIDPNETPDIAVKREVNEETGLEIRLLQYSPVPEEGNIEEKCALPFDSNVHSVGDHNHHCHFYLAEATDPEKLKANEEEIAGSQWYLRAELDDPKIPVDVRNIALHAFDLYESI